MTIKNTITAAAITMTFGLAGLLATAAPATADPCDDMHWDCGDSVTVDEATVDGDEDMHW